MERIRRGERVRAFELIAPSMVGSVRLSVSVLPFPDPRTGRLGVLVHLGRVVQEGPAWPPALRIRLLGTVEVRRGDGSSVEGPLWRRAKVRALLALLAVHRGRPLHRDAVLESLWPGLEYPAALHNLNTTVYNLRRSLEPYLRHGADSRYVRYAGECLYLNGGFLHWVDSVAFEAGVGRARREADPARASALYREALALYRDDFLAELLPGLDARWCWAERDRLRELYLAALEELGVLWERQGRDGEARELYLRVLSLEPCREAVSRRLMRLLLRRGDRAGAASEYRRLADVLRRELDLEPSAETVAVLEEARRR
jgi:DNA-binding SARP family transcriptional activator